MTETRRWLLLWRVDPIEVTSSLSVEEVVAILISSVARGSAGRRAVSPAG